MLTEIKLTGKEDLGPLGLVDRALNGEVFLIRNALQQFDLMGGLVEASLEGVRRIAGDEAARRIEAEGFNHIHKRIPPEDIPAMTEAVYTAVRPVFPAFLRKFVHKAFPGATTLYYEESPNIRFHIPFDLASAHKASFKAFAKSYGEGKISAHGPHRDSWLDCPSNSVNLWFAIGPVRKGNGLTIYAEDYGGNFKYKLSGDIADGEKLRKPLTFDLAPGDCILFHAEHVHGSELNRTGETRFVISFRMTFDKPHFPNRQIHRYVSARSIESPLRRFARIPAMLQPSYPRSLIRRGAEKLSLRKPIDIPAAEPEQIGVEHNGKIRVPLGDVPVGTVRGVSLTLCVARLSATEAIATTRRCPHNGGDFANGWTEGRKIVCPWHNLPFDASTGRSPCKSLAPVWRVHCEIVGEEIVVDPARQFCSHEMQSAGTPV
ncbi:MAG: phytanoyl-CoA dioxygenase family protein [Beijerinckiaceae bacterium]|nr:phytanoyl-CoA dioxygenase family protein [Beijerinckiaceae bacterium]